MPIWPTTAMRPVEAGERAKWDNEFEWAVPTGDTVEGYPTYKVCKRRSNASDESMLNL